LNNPRRVIFLKVLSMTNGSPPYPDFLKPYRARIKAKLPVDWIEGPARKGGGWRWSDPNRPNHQIRIDPGRSDVSMPTQQVDHVIVNHNGVIIGRDGQPLSGSIEEEYERIFPSPNGWIGKRGTARRKIVVKHPWMRKQVIETLEGLSDPDYQRRAWVDHQFPPGIQYDSFDLAVNVLFDDTPLFDAPETTIGYILEDEDEMHAVTRVIRAIDDVLNQLGTNLTDEQYITSPEWQPVVAAARAALPILKKPQPDTPESC
jgi:hypothetical protein